jgi:hypothetical protein
MSQAPELPEAKDPFEKAVAVSIACMAVVLAFIDDHADDAKTEAILSTNEAANAWSYFQAKSIKQQVSESDLHLLHALAPTNAGDLPAQLEADVGRYASEKDEIKARAEELGELASHAREVDDRAGQGALFLQLAIVLASVSLLARWNKMWIASLLVALGGAAVGLSSWTI